MLFFSILALTFAAMQSHVIRRRDVTTSTHDVVCYYTNWAQYRAYPARFVPENIDPELCTHIIFSFAQIVNNELTYYEWNDAAMIAKITAFKNTYRHLKVLIAVGGYSHEIYSSPFSTMSASKDSRTKFISSVLRFLRDHNLDGLDLDWEFPTKDPHGVADDKPNFTLLCQELKEEFIKYGYILTAAVSANQNWIPNFYEVARLGSYLDALHLMAYDLAGGWDRRIGHHTALHEIPTRSFSVENSLNAWLYGGFPKEKIVLGIATYGRSFTINPASSAIGDYGSYGRSGDFTRSRGSLAYFEICELISQGMKETFDNFRKVPFGVQGDQWVGYENVQSVIEKAKFIKSQGLKGAMFWSLDFDDFTGTFCDNGKYPLLNAVKNQLAMKEITQEDNSQIAKETLLDISSAKEASVDNNDAQTNDNAKAGDEQTSDRNNDNDDNTNDAQTNDNTEGGDEQISDRNNDNDDNTNDAQTNDNTEGGDEQTSNRNNDNDDGTSTTESNTSSSTFSVVSIIVDRTKSDTKKCVGVPPYIGDDHDKWCNDNCPKGYCPATHCKCE